MPRARSRGPVGRVGRVGRFATALSMTVLAAVVGHQPAAQAAPVLDCSGIYAVQGSGTPKSLWSVNTGTGDLTSVGSFAPPAADDVAVNGLGISAGGTRAYTVQATGTGADIFRHDRASGTTVKVGSAVDVVRTSHGAVNPLNGHYYYGGFAADKKLYVYGFNTTTNTSMGLVASGSVPAPANGANGDWTFDRQGRLYVVVGEPGLNYVSSVNQQIPAGGAAISITAKQMTTITETASGINGIAFAGDGYLYLGSSDTLYQVNPGSGAVVNDVEFESTTNSSVDLASCASPSTVTVQGSFPDGRASAGDQVTLRVTGPGVDTTGTTSGTDGGAQTGATEAAGPVFALAGQNYTVTATGPGTASPDYTTAWQCVDLNDSATIAAGTGASGTFAMPNKGPGGVAALCTVTSAAQLPEVALDVRVASQSGSTPGSTVTFAYDVTNTGTTPVTVTIADPRFGPVTCPTEPVERDATVTCTATAYTLTQADVDAGGLTATATATGTPTTAGLDPATDGDTQTVPITRTSTLSLAQVVRTDDVDSNELLDAGDEVTADYVVTNTGNTTLTSVGVTTSLGTATCTPTTLAPAEEAECTLSAPYTLTPADEEAGSLAATAVAGATAPTGPVGSAQVSRTLEVEAAVPSLVIEGEADVRDTNDSGITDAGDLVDYTYTVRNDGNVALDDLGLESGLVGELSCAATSLAPGASTVCTSTASYTVTADDEESGSVVEETTATAVLPDSTPLAPVTGTVTTPVITPAPVLSLEGADPTWEDVNSSDIRDTGDRITFRYTLTNEGNVPLAEVSLLGGLPESAVCEADALAVGATTTCAVTHVITEAEELAGEVRQDARGSAVDPDGDPVQSTEDVRTVAVARSAPALSIEAEEPEVRDLDNGGFTDAGDEIVFRYRVTNDGNVPLTAATVEDSLGGAVTCEATALDVEDDMVCVADAPYIVTAADEQAGEVVDTARAAALDPDGDRVQSEVATTRVPVALPRPAISVTLRADHEDADQDGLIDAGEQVWFRSTVTNTGDRVLSAVEVSSAIHGTVVCEPTTLAPEESAECVAESAYTVTAADIDAGVLRETVVATGTARQPGGGTGPVTAEDAVTLDADVRSSLEVSVAGDLQDRDGDDRADAGEVIRYTFTVTNTGTTTVDQIAVSAPRLDSAGVTVTCEKDVLAAGESMTCTADYVVTEEDALLGEIDLVAVAAGCGVGGCTLTAVSSDEAEVVTEVDTVDTVVEEPQEPVEEPETPVAAPQPPTGGLPATGGPDGALLAAGLLSLVGGAGALIVARRRAVS